MTPARRSAFRIASWALATLAALSLLGLLAATLLLPGWVTGRGAALAAEALGRPVTIEQARFQAWRLGVVLDGVRVGGRAQAEPPLLKLAQVDVSLSLRSLLRGRAVVDSLRLTRPELHLARVADGHYDFDDLIQRFAAEPGAPGAPPPEFAVYNIVLSDGRLVFDDRPVQRRHEIASLHLALPFVSTLAADVAVTVAPRLSGRLDGVPFDASGEVLPFAADPSARLQFKLVGLDLAPLGVYVPASVPARLDAGRLDLDLALDFAERPRQAPGVKLSGMVVLHDLAVAQRGGQPWVGWKRLSVPLTDVQPLRRQLGFGQILLDAPTGWMRPLPALPRDEAATTAPSAPWQFSVAGLEVRDGRFSVDDLAVDAIQLKLGAAAWPLKAVTQADASMRLGQATLTAKARLAPELLEASAELDGLAVERLATWLPLPGRAKLTAAVSSRASLRVQEPLADGAVDRAELALEDLRIQNVRLGLPGTPRLLTLADVQLDRAAISAAAHHIELGTLKLDAPRGQLARSADGRFNIDALLAQEGAPASKAGPAWRVTLARLAVERGAVRWHDAAVPAGVAPVALAVEPFSLQTGALAWPATAPVDARLSAQLAALGANDQPTRSSAGSVQWTGRVGIAPLSAQGSVQARALPLQLFNAYLDPSFGLHLQRAELGMRATVKVAQQAGGTWQAAANGDMRVGLLALMQTRVIDGARVVGEELLNWQLLQLDGAQVTLAPQAPARVTVREARLDDAYARLIIDEQGRFNLRDIGPAEAAAEAAADAVAVADAALDASDAASAPAPAGAASGPGLEFAVERIQLNRGLVDFSDRFVRPNYSARLTELTGSLGAFSSSGTAMAPLTVKGRVAGTGLLEIDGQLKPGAPLALDIAANATDIELAPLSPYAGKYAGYAIERGKLSTKLRYQVAPGGELTASNQIILNQLTFGDKVDSPSATSLPVRFAVSLLKDRDGVIDVNLPVSGSLNDPHFSVGGIVWKLILNLIGKALTSPFSLFMGSDAPEAAQIMFTPGGAELAESDKLDRIATLLADKPGVQLTLTGWADPAAEAAAIREQRLANALKAENAAAGDAALKRLYDGTKLPNKPRNMLGFAKSVPPAQMKALLLASYKVDDESLRQLGVVRAVAVRDALLARGAPNARVFLAAPRLCSGACEAGWRPHVELTLAAH